MTAPPSPADIPRITAPTRAVLGALAACPQGTYGHEICKATGLKPGTVHPILKRWVDAGMLERFWEDPAQVLGMGRPLRRYYRLTAHGDALVKALRL